MLSRGCIIWGWWLCARVPIGAGACGEMYAPQTTQEQIGDTSVRGLCKMSATNWNRKIPVSHNFYLSAVFR